MIENRQRRGWILVAAIAIGVALALLLALNAHSGDAGALVAILPLLFVGIISPLSLLAPLAVAYAGRTPDAPALPASFQRPPPSSRV
jgi:ABC-type arginine/histidine transport system permease subunit